MKHLLHLVLFIIFLPLLLMFILGEFSLGGFMDAPSLVGYLLAYCGVLLVTGEGKTYVRALNALFSPKYSISFQDRQRAIVLFKMFIRVTNYTSAFLFFVGLVGMLGYLDDPLLLGPMLSVALIAPMYGAVINIIFLLPATHILEHRKNPEDTAITERQVMDKLLELCHKQGISPEEIMDADEISLGGENSK